MSEHKVIENRFVCRMCPAIWIMQNCTATTCPACGQGNVVLTSSSVPSAELITEPMPTGNSMDPQSTRFSLLELS